ncbi:RHS repeat-associated core domain protein containing protein [Herbaspirillum sp. CF444]|uniref:RHS repeat-associated core domain-containing protein n=1 Tax=Herbaspirillum sp. CF444 TaxID=1144319 RepID=UPI00027257D1|nr:RHS repeat-associated core domain-containing protein [Herbaspirillum sp. CF444]EJL88097.1 RHS repeat-associated core domain protein containing protein [Herbaspirillum sp. CF444]
MNELLGYNGQRRDPVSGTYHLGNGYRAYNPVLMRFNSPDAWSPFGAGGINAYAYCAGDPVNYADPSGHLSWQAWLGISMGIAGLALTIVTAGASMAAAGGVMAAIESTSAVSLAVGITGALADVSAIASGASEDVDPQASAILGWVSMGTGAVGLVQGGIVLARRANSLYETGVGIALGKTRGLSRRLGRLLDPKSGGLSGRGRGFRSENHPELTLNSKGLHEETFSGPLYRVEASTVDVDLILENGFNRSSQFGGVRKMIPDEHDALIVSESKEGAEIFNQRQHRGEGHIFEIGRNAEEDTPLQIRGVSLRKNFHLNRNNLMHHLSTPEMHVTRLADEGDLQLYSANANMYAEAHIYLRDIRRENIFFLVE